MPSRKRVLPSDQRESITSIVHRLRSSISGKSYRKIADDTGFHPETVRRYLNAHTKVLPCQFILKVCDAYDLDLEVIMRGHATAPNPQALQLANTAELYNELGRRHTRLENIIIGSSLSPAAMPTEYKPDLEQSTSEAKPLRARPLNPPLGQTTEIQQRGDLP